MDAEDRNYICTLTEKSLAKACKELNEDSKQRLGAVKTLRQWINQQPHFTCRTDTMFLLQILRRCKFSQLVSREIITNLLTMKTKNPEYMCNLDLQEPAVEAMIRAGTAITSPIKDAEGRILLICRPAKYPDLSNELYSSLNEMRVGLMMSELRRLLEEDVVVNGINVCFDFTGISMKYLTRNTAEERRISSKIWQDCNPERIKTFIIYNAGPILEFFLNSVKQFMKKKNQERIEIHETMESMYKIIPMECWPNEYLPDNYTGPSAGTIAQITEDYLKTVKNPTYRQSILKFTSDKYRIDEKKAPSAHAQVPNESFRKLNID